MATKRTYSTPESVFRPAQSIVGVSATLSLRAAQENQTVNRLATELYERREEIEHRQDDTLVLFQRYPIHRRFDDLVPYTFTLGWMVQCLGPLPPGMVGLTLPPGEYARFIHTGAEHEIAATYRGIYGRTLRSMGRWAAGYDYEVWTGYNPLLHRRSMVTIYVSLQRRFATRRSYLSDDAAIWDGYTEPSSSDEAV